MVLRPAVRDYHTNSARIYPTQLPHNNFLFSAPRGACGTRRAQRSATNNSRDHFSGLLNRRTFPLHCRSWFASAIKHITSGTDVRHVVLGVCCAPNQNRNSSEGLGSRPLTTTVMHTTLLLAQDADAFSSLFFFFVA